MFLVFDRKLKYDFFRNIFVHIKKSIIFAK